MDVEQHIDRLARLDAARGHDPRPVGERATIAAARRDGAQLWLSGQVAARDGVLVAVGQVGAAVDVDTARRCARQCALNLLGVAEREVGLSQVQSVLRLTVYVSSAPQFAEQHIVADAATDVFRDVLGVEPHVRTALGVAALPLGSAVEADAVLIIRDDAAAPSA